MKKKSKFRIHWGLISLLTGSVFILNANASFAGWGIKDLDPTCKNSGLRKTCRESDQKCRASQARLEKISQDIGKKASMISKDMVEKIRKYVEVQANCMTKKEMDTRPTQDAEEVFEEYFAAAFAVAVAGGVAGFFAAGPAGVFVGAVEGCASSIAGMAAFRGAKGNLDNWHEEGN